MNEEESGLAGETQATNKVPYPNPSGELEDVTLDYLENCRLNKS